VWDITKIVLMVARSLLRSGMAPMGLVRSLGPAPVLPGRQAMPAPVAATKGLAEAGKPSIQ